jgi:hypothetical protein
VNVLHHLRGGLATLSASLLFKLSGEVLKWQFPALAFGAVVTSVLAAARHSLPLACRSLQN